MAWPLALLFHLLGNSNHLSALVDGLPTVVALLQIMMVVLIVLVLLAPRPPYVLILSFIYLMITYYKAPFIGNHEVILGLAALVVMLSVMVGDRRWASLALPNLRWVLVLAYGAIAISKLNGSFFDPSVSCAAVFGDELGGHIGLRVTDYRSLSLGAIWVTALVELAIPVLLVVRRLRAAGLLLALLFHFVLALEPVGHVFDFTATLFPLFLTFAPREVLEELTARIERLGGGLGSRALALAALIVVVLHTVVMVGDWPIWAVAYPAWLIVGTTTLWWVVPSVLTRVRGGAGWSGDALEIRGPMAILVPVVLLVALNGIAPYVGLRTAAAFNMYSNLETVGVDGDHLLLGGLGNVRSHELVMVVDAPDDHPLAYYAEQDRAVPVDNLRWYTRARRATASPEDLTADEQVTLEWVSPAVLDRPVTLSDLEVGPGGWRETMAHKFGFVRAVDLSSPAGCLRTWGVAG